MLGAGYLAAVSTPAAVIWATPPPPGRSVLADVTAALGYGAAVALCLQLVLPSRAPWLTRHFGADVLIRYHREIATAIVGLVGLHLVVLFVDEPGRIGLLVPTTAPPRAMAASAATVCLAALLLTSRRRRRLGLSYETWRAIHVILSVAVVVFTAVHVLGVAVYSAPPLMQVGVVLAVVGSVGSVLHLRWHRPARHQLPYRVVRVRPERGGASTVALQPAGHPGAAFEAGQFAWVKPASRPHSLSEHPFSYASSAEAPSLVEFTVKNVGDFTAGVEAVVPGTLLLVDGPHGSFAPADPRASYLFVAGGVGITPVMSFLRSFADRHDRRPVTLVYGSRNWESVTFREELDALAERLDLTVVHVLADPPPGWQGATGFIDAALLQRVLDGQPDPVNVFVCGPPPMCDAVRSATDALGVPRRQVHVESFVSV